MNSAFPSFLRHYRHLLFLIPPLAVLAIANLFFEFSLEPWKYPAECLQILFGSAAGNQSELRALQEIGARYLWLSSCIALTVTSLASIAVSCITLRNCLSPRRCAFATLLALAIATGHLVYLYLVPTSVRCVNFDFTLQILRESAGFSKAFLDHQVEPVAFVVVVVSTVAAMFLLVAAASTTSLCAAPANMDNAGAGIRMDRLRSVLYIGSIMLITGIINIGSWMRWPAALFPSRDANEIIRMTLGVTTFWGATFTLTATAAYVPPAIYLRRRALNVFHRDHPSKTSADQEEWLKKQKLTISPGSQVIPIAALLGPLIAGPLGSLLGQLLKMSIGS